MSTAQSLVVELAKLRLKKVNISFICLDLLSSDEEIKRDGIDACADILYYDSLCWQYSNVFCDRTIPKLESIS